MKFAYSTIATLVVGALATPSPWCTRMFSDCGKRDAVLDPTLQEREALPEPEPLPWCLREGKPCTKREALPEPWCFSSARPCGRKRDTIEANFPEQSSDSYAGRLKRAAYSFVQGLQSTPALAQRQLSPEADLSNLPGGAAYRIKRSVEELSDLIATASADPAGISADHDLSGEFEPDSSTTTKREASPWCMSRHFNPCGKRDVLADKEHCNGEKEACYKAKRTAEALLHSIGDVTALKAREESEEESKARREVLAIQKAARDLLDWID